ncbi:MAG: IS1182 family transposase, partial [Tissierellia bacterium]|nr:IS1182 family transposase [Tissierellia bacterium]
MEVFIHTLEDHGLMTVTSIYMDGTKIESKAGKYTFVWKKAIENYREKLRKKITKHFSLDEDTDLTTITKILHR